MAQQKHIPYTPSFFCYRKDRDVGRGGGVAIIIRKNLEHIRIPSVNTTVIENVGIQLKLPNYKTLNIYSCYFPGGSNHTNSSKANFCSDLKLFSRLNCDYILGGDFNSRHRHWGCLRANCWGNLLFSLLAMNTFSLLFPLNHTYIPSNVKANSSTLDVFITNIPNYFAPITTLNQLNSDHLPIVTCFNKSACIYNKYFRDFRKANWKKFKQFINQNIGNIVHTIQDKDDINHLVDKFSRLILEAVEISVPKKIRTNIYIKRIPSFILNLISERNQLRRKWIRYRHPYFKTKLNQLNNDIKKHIICLRNNEWNDTLADLTKSSKQFWNLTKIIKNKGNHIPIIVDNGINYVTNQEKAEILAQTFSLNYDISQRTSNENTIQLVNESLRKISSSTSINNQNHVSTHIVKDMLKCLNKRKSPGMDNISNQCLKHLPASGVNLLTDIFNKCFQHCHFPDIWKTSKIIPIKKPNKESSSPFSYRPINLLSSISKILEKIIKNKLCETIENNNILPPQQFGFRPEHNTIHPLIRVKNKIKNSFLQGKSTAMVLLDIKCAFDSVWHEALIHKMLKFGFNVSLIKLIHSFLSDRSFQVFIGDQHSSILKFQAGCPQGACLSPILYNIYTSDFPSLNGCDSSIFADDTAVICSGIYGTDIVRTLQGGINILNDYFQKWKIEVNASKTQAIFFSRKRKPCFLPPCNININNNSIEWVDSVKYLGVIFDKKIIFKDHINGLINKANKTIKILYPFINRKSKLSLENKIIIYKVVFQTMMLYAAPLWQCAAKTHIQKVQICQNKILKLIYDLPFFYSTNRLHLLDNIMPIKDKIDIITSKFVDKCVHSPHTYINNLYS